MISQEEAQIYKRFYEQVLTRPQNVHCGAKMDYIKSRILDVQQELSALTPISGVIPIDDKV